jgi:hypothetical protein
LQESIEGSVTPGRIAFLEVDLDLDRMLIVGIPEAVERLLRHARITVAQDDQPGSRDHLGQHGISLDDGIGNHLEHRLERVQNLLGLARRHFLPPLLSTFAGMV